MDAFSLVINTVEHKILLYNINIKKKKNIIYNLGILLLHFLIAIMSFQKNVDILSGYFSLSDFINILFLVFTIIINVLLFMSFINDSCGRIAYDFIMTELFAFSFILVLRYANKIPETDYLNTVLLKLLFTVFALIHPYISIPTIIANYCDSKITVWIVYLRFIILITILRVLKKKILKKQVSKPFNEI